MESTQLTNQRFEFRFVTVLASHAEGTSENGTSEPDVKALDALGRDGWQIAGIMPDPLLPAARFLVSLQRPAA
jgi:hypothetical protein